MSEATTTRNFRENLKYFFDLARNSPVAINRGAERYVLLSENEYAKMKEEVLNLQKSLISSLQHINNEAGPEINLSESEDNDDLLQEYIQKYHQQLKGKKVKAG